MEKEEMVKLKAEIYDIIVEQDKLAKQYQQLNEKQALLQKQIQAAKK